MKFFIYAIVIIIIISILCTWGTVVSTKKIDYLLAVLENAKPLDENVPSNAAETVKKISTQWEKDMFIISMLLPHNRLDDVKEKLVKLEAYANTDEFAEWRDAMLVFREELLHIRDLLGVSADNIL